MGMVMTVRLPEMGAAYERLKWAATERGYRDSTALAEACGMVKSTARAHLNGTRKMNQHHAKGYAELLGVPWRWLLDGDTVGPAKTKLNMITVRGAVEGGRWAEITDWPEADQYDYPMAPDARFPKAKPFGLEVKGQEFNLVYPPGTVLACIPISEMPHQQLTPGKKVIVERRNYQGQVETSVREYSIDPQGRPWLLARSSNPEFQAPIRLDPNDSTLKIVAVVIISMRPE